MKFTEEKLEKAFTELLGQEGFAQFLVTTFTPKPQTEFKLENVKSIQVVTSQTCCEFTTIPSKFKMSSFLLQKLDILKI